MWSTPTFRPDTASCRQEIDCLCPADTHVLMQRTGPEGSGCQRLTCWGLGGACGTASWAMSVASGRLPETTAVSIWADFAFAGRTDRDEPPLGTHQGCAEWMGRCGDGKFTESGVLRTELFQGTSQVITPDTVARGTQECLGQERGREFGWLTRDATRRPYIAQTK